MKIPLYNRIPACLAFHMTYFACSAYIKLKVVHNSEAFVASVHGRTEFFCDAGSILFIETSGTSSDFSKDSQAC